VSAVRVKKKRQIKKSSARSIPSNGKRSGAPAQPTRPMSRLFPAANSEPASRQMKIIMGIRDQRIRR
jgi:hypothetical protein